MGVDTAWPSRPRGGLSRALISFRKGAVESSKILFNAYNTLKCLTEDEASRRVTQASSISAPERGLDWLSSLAPPDLPNRINRNYNAGKMAKKE